MRFLEKNGRLDRAIEFLPTDDEIAERKARGLGLTSRAGGAAGLQQDVAVRRAGGLRPAGGPVGSHRAGALLPDRAASENSPATSRAIRCGARSSPPMCSTAWSTASAPTFVHRLAELTGATRAAGRAGLPGSARGVRPGAAVAADRGAGQPGAPTASSREMIVEWRRLIARATTWFLRSRRLAEPTEQQRERLSRRRWQALRTRLEPKPPASPQVAAWVQAGVPQRAGAAGRCGRSPVQRAGHRRDRRGRQAAAGRRRRRCTSASASAWGWSGCGSRSSCCRPTATGRRWPSGAGRRPGRPAALHRAGRGARPPGAAARDARVVGGAQPAGAARGRSACWPSWRHAEPPIWRCCRWRCANCATWYDVCIRSGTSIALHRTDNTNSEGSQMSGKPDETQKRKEKPRAPSTGRGADSAMDALIKGRVPHPGSRGSRRIRRPRSIEMACYAPRFNNLGSHSNVQRSDHARHGRGTNEQAATVRSLLHRDPYRPACTEPVRRIFEKRDDRLVHYVACSPR